MRVTSYFAGLMLVGLMLATSSFAQISPKVDAKVIRDFARLSFGHSTPLKMRSAAKGRQIRLRFEQPVNIRPAPLLQKLRPYVVSISQSKDKKSVLITTNRDYRTRNFVSGGRTGIDIIGLQKGGNQEPVKAAEVASPPKPAAPKATPLPPKPKKPKLEAKKPTPKPSKPKKTPPVAKAEPPKAPAPRLPAIAAVIPKFKPEMVSEMPATQKPPSAPVTVVLPTSEPEVKSEKVEVVVQPKQTAAPVAKVEIVEPKKPVKEKELGKLVGGAKDIQVEALEDGVALIFPWDRRVATAVLRRANRTLIVFSDQQAFNPAFARKNTHISKVQTSAIDAKKPAQLWVIDTPLSGVKVSKDSESFHWRVEMIEDDILPKSLLKPQPMVEPPLKPHLFIPTLEVTTPVKFYDPLIGDEVTAVPMYKGGVGVSPARRFAEFYMPLSAQGIFVHDALPDLRIARTRSGLKITAPEGILISQDLPPVQLPEEALADSKASDTFFPYQYWIAPEGETANTYENRLWSQAANIDIKKRRIPRKRLAQLYLSQGKASEAITVLKKLAEESPIYFTRNKLHALLGAAQFMNNQYLQAETSFKHATLADEKELNFWRDLLGVLLRGEGLADYQAYHNKYIRHYPPLMRQRLAVSAADHFINLKKYNKALKIFDTLNKNNMIEEINDKVQFMIARVLAGTTQKDAARLMWQQLAQDVDNRYIRPRALFAMTNLDLAENKITIKEAIGQLEALRIVWRGDEFEITLLTLLTRLYEEEKMYREALRAYREIVTYFPNHPKNLEITARMAEIFRKLFNENGAQAMPPLQALALYYEFRNLTPIGQEGDKMIQNLADRLTDIELLHRAAALLQHQVEFRLSGEERSRVGARLALVHLLRRKPKEALNVLELTGFGDNPESLQQQRALLTARALMELGEGERAYQLLEGNDTREAGLLKLSILWKKQRWAELIQVGEELMGDRKDPSLQLSKEEFDVLTKLAIGYVFDKQPGQLQYLRDYFSPLIDAKEDKELFAFITDDTKIDPRNMEKLGEQISRMESFLESYRKKIKEGGLSSAVQ